MDQCIVGEGTSSIGAVGEGSGLGLGQINGIMSEIGLGKELGLGPWSEEKRKGDVKLQVKARKDKKIL